MPKLTLLSIGKLKREFEPAAAMYQARLKPFCKLLVKELPEAFLPENPSSEQIKKALDVEAKGILSAAKGMKIALCVEGESFSSERFAELIAEAPSQISFIIGSSHGLSDTVKKACDAKISFSAMTFPHSLMRIVLLEQIYRGFMIGSGAKYHK
jgi:23S rRNA (pseudouridine1915-N3)-methyltransferase